MIKEKERGRDIEEVWKGSSEKEREIGKGVGGTGRDSEGVNEGSEDCNVYRSRRWRERDKGRD